MASFKRRILGLTVISAGVCAALPFRNDAVDTSVAPRDGVESPAAAVPSRDELTLQLTIPTSPVTAASGGSPAPSVARPATPQPPQVRRDDLHTPPKLSSSFESFAATYPVASTVTPTPEETDKPARVHRIVDGETLESLAERYLGDRRQWREIFAANGHVLTDPEILPIGKEIKIPHTTVERSNAPRDDDPVDQLVPIPAELLNRVE